MEMGTGPTEFVLDSLTSTPWDLLWALGKEAWDLVSASFEILDHSQMV